MIEDKHILQMREDLNGLSRSVRESLEIIKDTNKQTSDAHFKLMILVIALVGSLAKSGLIDTTELNALTMEMEKLGPKGLSEAMGALGQ